MRAHNNLETFEMKVDNLQGRQPSGKASFGEDNLQGRQPSGKTTYMEDDLKGR
jgi:hypothetical protein